MQKLIELARKLGLNEYESKAYVSLLKLGTANVSVIAEKAEIPRARVYDVLVSLLNKGFISQRPVKPVQYSAIPLKHALASVKSRKESDLKNHFSELDSIVSLLQTQIEGSESKSNAISVDSAALLSGRKNIYSAISNAGSKVVFVGPRESIDSFKEHASRRKISYSSLESDTSKFALLDKDSVVLFLNHSANEKEEKALLINSRLAANHFSSCLKKK